MPLIKKIFTFWSIFLLAASVTYAAEPILASISFGSVGFGSWNTQVEFKDIQVAGADGQVLYRAGELKDLSDWTTNGGEWSAKNGVLVQSGSGTPAIAVLKRKWGDCTLTFQARKTGGAEGFLIPFQLGTNQQAKHWWRLGGGDKSNQSYLEGDDLPRDGKDFSVELNRWYSIKLEIKGAHLRCSVDDKVLHDITRGLSLIGFGTWNTQAEFKDIRIIDTDGRPLFKLADSTDLSGWQLRQGKWSLKDGVLVQTGKEMPAITLLDKSWGDCTLQFQARKTGGNEGFLITFQAKDVAEKRWWNLGGWGNKGSAVEGDDFTCPQKPVTIEQDRWYNIKIEMEGKTARFYLDDKLMHEITASK